MKVLYIIIIFVIILLMMLYLTCNKKEKNTISKIDDEVSGYNGKLDTEYSPDIFREELLKLLLNISLLLKQNHVQHCIIYGSLLGIIREKNIIKGDDDTDIFVFKEDFDRLRKILDYSKLYYKYNTNIIQVSFNNINNIGKHKYPFMDIYRIEENNNILYDVWNGRAFTKSDILPIKTIPFKGNDLYVPRYYKKILRLVYGKNWTIPSSNKYDGKIDRKDVILYKGRTYDLLSD